MSTSIRKKLFGKDSSLDLAKRRHKLEEGEGHPVSELLGYQEGGYYRVSVDLIKPNPKQPRQHFDQDSLVELSSSIKEKGLLQPIIITFLKGDRNTPVLVAGERRWRAAKMAGLETIPAIFTEGDPLEIAIIENLQREDLNPLEEAEALECLLKEHNYTHESLASIVGKSRTTITEALSLNRLPRIIKEECTLNNIYPRRVLIEVAKQKSPENMVSLFNQVKKLRLTSEEVRKMTRTTASKEKLSAEDVIFARLKSLHKYLISIDLETISLQRKSFLKRLKSLLEEVSK